MNADNRAKVIADSTHYQEAYLRLKETNDYAETRYRALERYIFVDGTESWLGRTGPWRRRGRHVRSLNRGRIGRPYE